MNIVGLFILRHYEPTTPELVTAWDEYTVDENPEGWKKECDRMLAMIGDDVLSKGFITISVRESELLKALNPTARVVGDIVRTETQG